MAENKHKKRTGHVLRHRRRRGGHLDLEHPLAAVRNLGALKGVGALPRLHGHLAQAKHPHLQQLLLQLRPGRRQEAPLRVQEAGDGWKLARI